jgi:hypothetical protein
MSTLIRVYDSEGLVGHCDASCYNAKHPDCTCICGGKNHGVGQVQAEANVRELGASILDPWKEEHGIVYLNTEAGVRFEEPYRCRFASGAFQPRLFDPDA